MEQHLNFDSFWRSITVAFRKYAVFSGRAARPEYWWFAAFCAVVGLIFTVSEGAEGIGLYSTLFAIATFIPSLSVTVRRLHDAGWSGWWVLLAALPIIGWIALAVICALPSEDADNARGPIAA